MRGKKKTGWSASLVALEVLQRPCQQAHEENLLISAESFAGVGINLPCDGCHNGLQRPTLFGEKDALHPFINRVGSALHKSGAHHALKQAGNGGGFQAQPLLQFHLRSTFLLPELFQHPPLGKSKVMCPQASIKLDGHHMGQFFKQIPQVAGFVHVPSFPHFIRMLIIWMNALFCQGIIQRSNRYTNHLLDNTLCYSTLVLTEKSRQSKAA